MSIVNRKTSLVAALLTAGALWTGTAHAGKVSISVGINVPPVAAVVSTGGHAGYYAAPDYGYRPGPVVYYRPPVVYAPAYRYHPHPYAKHYHYWHRGHEGRSWHDGRREGDRGDHRDHRDHRGDDGRGDNGHRGGDDGRRHRH